MKRSRAPRPSRIHAKLDDNARGAIKPSVIALCFFFFFLSRTARMVRGEVAKNHTACITARATATFATQVRRDACSVFSVRCAARRRSRKLRKHRDCQLLESFVEASRSI